MGRNEINPNFHQTPSSNFVHKSVKRYIRQSDGTVERTEIIRDNQGNEEKKVSRQLGDKTHIVVIKKDKDGIETKTEDIINMDEGEQFVFIKICLFEILENLLFHFNFR